MNYRPFDDTDDDFETDETEDNSYWQAWDKANPIDS
jgi:hypothetical protein